jgi:hypothetical protein
MRGSFGCAGSRHPERRLDALRGGLIRYSCWVGARLARVRWGVWGFWG